MTLQLRDGSELRGELRFVPMETGAIVADDDFTIPARVQEESGVKGQEFLQAVMNHAWDMGFRPTGFMDTKNEVSALRAHLHDMRALAFPNKVEPAK